MGQHVVKQLADALKALCVQANTAAGARVYVNRVSPPPILPAVVIETGDEDLEEGLQGSVSRELDVDLTVLLKQNDDYDAAAYEVLMDLEHLVAANPTAGGAANAISPYGVRWDRSGESEQPIVRASLRLRAYLTVQSSAVDVLT